MIQRNAKGKLSVYWICPPWIWAVTSYTIKQYSKYIDTVEPMARKMKRIFFLARSFSNIKTDNGTHTGHTSCANIRKRYTGKWRHDTWSAPDNPTHNIPSAACWTANNNGIRANGTCAGVSAFLRVTTPTAANTALAPKLAPAEKHIVLRYNGQTRFYVLRRSLPRRQ